MESTNPKEVRTSENVAAIDRISDLPDSILSKILSNLPTKYAVGASILSTRWKNLFPFGVPPVKLDLDDSLLINPRENDDKNVPSVSFMDFVDKLFNETLSDVPCVEQMALNCKKNYDDAKIVSWVCAALRVNVTCLDLDFSLKESHALFHSLNGCTTLVTMWLSMVSELCIPDDFILPNLENLHLIGLSFSDETGASINELIEGCPTLKDLSLAGCDLRCLELLHIESPLLDSLLIENSNVESAFRLTLDVPNLQALIYNDCVAIHHYISELKCLNAAHIEVGTRQQLLDEIDDSDDEDPWYFDEVGTLVRACSSATHLFIATCSIAILRYSSVPVPVYQNLIWLALGCLEDHSELLARLLVNAPCLEKLTLEEGFAKTEAGFALFQNFLSGPPICLKRHLKRIEFWVFEEKESEIKLVEYFLKNGRVLEELGIKCLPLDDVKIFRRLRMFPKQSKSCKIMFGSKERIHDV